MNDGVHTDKDEGDVNGDWGDLFKFVNGRVKDECLIDDNRVDYKANGGKKFEHESIEHIKYRQSHG